MPGWPELAFETPSADNSLTVSIAFLNTSHLQAIAFLLLLFLLDRLPCEAYTINKSIVKNLLLTSPSLLSLFLLLLALSF
jgi:hypothetical protein